MGRTKKTIFQIITKATKQDKKQLALLIDPNNYTFTTLHKTVTIAQENNVDYIFVGGSLLATNFEEIIVTLKSYTQIPIIIFPGDTYQLAPQADAMLFPSLISGRNPQYLIHNHVIAAPLIKKYNLETISTSYILVGNSHTTVQYVSNTQPIPNDNIELATATALAGEMLGHKLTYLEAGSGAKQTISLEMITAVKQQINNPLVVGGGIKTPEQLANIFQAGADVIVVGNAIEKTPQLLVQFRKVMHKYKQLSLYI